MPYWRSWGAALLGASGVALAVPVGLLLVVAVAAGLSGGLAFRDLGQVTAGPALPGSTKPVTARDAGLPPVPRTGTPRKGAGPRSSTAARRAPAPATSPGRQGAGGAPSPTGPPPRTPGSSSGPAAGTGTTLPTVPASAPVPPSGGTTTTTPNPLESVVAGVQETLEPVPVMGEDAVSSVAGLILPQGSPTPLGP